MRIVFILAGAFFGYTLGDMSDEALGLVVGALLGYLLFRLITMQQRIDDLTRRVAHKPAQAIPVAPPSVAKRPSSVPAPEPDGKIARRTTPIPSVRRQPAKPTLSPLPPRPPGTVDKLVALAKEWLTTGNVPVKLGVLVSFFGVAFLLKYAVDNQMLVIPLPLRYLFVAAIAGVFLAVGWRLRSSNRIYALSLQGGGIGVLYLTIFAALRLHGILPAPLAFTLLVLLTVFTGILAVLQNAKALSILGVVGGFLAPVLVSAGFGNHVAVFSYYLLINCAILGIAWHKSWRGLNVIGFLFTFGLGTFWGYEYYRPELFASTEPFLIAYFLFYQAIAVLFAFRQPPDLRGFVDGTLVFGAPVVVFALQSQLVDGTEYGLAISAISLALFYVLVASCLYRTQGQQLHLMIESFVALGVAFATIAIPLALDDRWTAVAWALEGAALVWVGVRQHGTLVKLSGIALLVASGIAYMLYGWRSGAGMPLLNGNFLGGMLIAVSSIFAARQLAADSQPSRFQHLLSALLLIWGLAWWAATGSSEIFDRASASYELHALTAFIAISAALLAWIGRRYEWLAARRLTLAYLPLLPIIAILYLWDHDHFLAGLGTLSWMVAFAAHLGLLWAYDNGRGKLEGIWHFAGVLFLASLLSIEVHWRMQQAALSDTWTSSGALLVPLAIAAAILYLHDRLAWPLRRYWSAYLGAAGALVVLQLLAMTIVGLDQPGDPAPLPYIPLLNPFDVLTLLGLVTAMKLLAVGQTASGWLGRDSMRAATAAWGVAAFVLTTIAVVRGVHHFSDVAWRQHTLMGAVQVQSALSIYWAILGFSGMVWGARHARRWVWIGGTSLMVLVVAKLFLVDLGNTGTVARIVSFLGVGGLLLVVGYFAPAPPREATADE